MVTKGRKVEQISGGMDTASEDQEDLATMWEAWTPSKILGTRFIPHQLVFLGHGINIGLDLVRLAWCTLSS